MAKLAVKFPAGDRLNGFPVAVGEELLLLQETWDFYLIGYKVVPLSNVDSVRCGAYERTFRNIFAAEGLLDRVGVTRPVPLDDLPSLFRALASPGRYVAIEYKPRELDDGEDIFLLGEIAGVNAQAVSLRHFDADAVWEPEPATIKHENVLAVAFDSDYINVWTRYMARLE